MFAILRSLRATALALGFLTVAGLAPPADAATPADAEKFIRELGQEAISKLSDESVPMETRVQHFRTLVNEGFAMETISRFVLGRYVRVASDEEMAEFRDVFLRVVTQRFLPLFEGYTQDDFVIDGAQVDPRSDKLFLVKSRVRSPTNGQFAKAGWRVQNRGDGMQIVDVVAEGVSMAITLRSEYSSVIRQNGGQVSALIAKLRQNIEKDSTQADTVEQAER
jgi:phospholipid transport system substrate-binding protein